MYQAPYAGRETGDNGRSQTSTKREKQRIGPKPAKGGKHPCRNSQPPDVDTPLGCARRYSACAMPQFQAAEDEQGPIRHVSLAIRRSIQPAPQSASGEGHCRNAGGKEWREPLISTRPMR